MVPWPAITEPLLRERQAMTNEEFETFMLGLLDQIGRRELPDGHYDVAIGYPWERPAGSCLVTDGQVEDVADDDRARWDELLERYVADPERVPLLAYGANASPHRLAMKLAPLPDGEREALILAAMLEDFDVGAAAQPPIFSSMPATLVASPGTSVRVAILFLTPVQFTMLWWTEVSYRVGALSGIRVTTPVTDAPIERVIAFSSRWGVFCPDGEPAAMAAIPAESRRFRALTQVELLDTAARLTLGEGANARDLITAAFCDPPAFLADHLDDFRAVSAPFRSDHWEEMPTEAG